jgi:hypothetical protein
MEKALITYLKQGDINNPNNWDTVVCYYDCELELFEAEDNLVSSGEAICIIKTEKIKGEY